MVHTSTVGLDEYQRRISFGKHKGTPVGDLPEDYVKWLAHGTKESGLVELHRDGIEWSAYAQREFDRRSQGSVIVPMPPSSNAINTDAKEVPDRISPSGPVFVSTLAVEQLIDIFIREYILRQDKTELLYKWTIAFAKEALTQRQDELLAPGSQIFTYLGARWYFDTANKSLTKVERIVT